MHKIQLTAEASAARRLSKLGGGGARKMSAAARRDRRRALVTHKLTRRAWAAETGGTGGTKPPNFWNGGFKPPNFLKCVPLKPQYKIMI